MTLTIAQRIEMARAAHAEGRIIQNQWRHPQDGRELVCALAAFGPDINSAADCPADLMPQWLAALVPNIDDGIAASEVPWFSGALIERASRWYALDDAAWERIRTGFMVAAIRQALASAEPVQPSPAPGYWQTVVDACNGVIAALEEGGDLKNAAAYAAYAAADAADAAYAAKAAADAAYAADAADAAKAAADAAWKQIAETLFRLIDIEIDACLSEMADG